MASGPIMLVLEVDAGSEPLHGRIVPSAGAPREFSGWLELLDVLAELVDPPP